MTCEVKLLFGLIKNKVEFIATEEIIMKYNKQYVIDNPDIPIITFYGHSGKGKMNKRCLSNFFERDNLIKFAQMTFSSSEQLFMWHKAKTFEDEYYANLILNCNSASLSKQYGRLVSNFNENIWFDKKEDIMLLCLFLKFFKNQDLKDYLISTGDSILVEAAKYDKIWGVGCNHDEAKDVNNWQGDNLLGFLLMKVRDLL